MTDTLSHPEPGTVPHGRPRRVILITGLSGAGMTTALKALEDLGHEAVDNLPLALVPPLIDQVSQHDRPIAISIDSRTRDFSADALLAHLAALKARPEFEVHLLFVDCDPDVLQRRFTETRRRHPLAVDRPVADGISRELQMLAPLRDQADMVVDTSILTIHELRRMMAAQFALTKEPGLYIFVTSFAFRRGLPREADLVFDVRFLDNPHWDPELRPLTGLDAPVQEAITRDQDFDRFFDGLTGLLRPLLPRYNQEGKSYLTIAIGCSGGKHRSVYIAERLADWLRSQGFRIGLMHRDLPPPGELRRSGGTDPVETGGKE
ncbi:MAG TPA: RNase adapter RapZ [Alphaproteobacteria bacterium]|nr:RNase adapter RapZ [Alphaproteobacteria bacterium]